MGEFIDAQRNGTSLAGESHNPFAPPASAAWDGRAPRGPRRVLCADDSDVIRLYYSRVFSLLGIEADVVADGSEAWQLLQAQPGEYALVISDFDMPMMNGFELVRALRLCGSGIPVCVASSRDRSSMAAVFTGLDVSAILQKPVSLDDLRNLTSRHLGRVR